jgi:hypothetical protein
MTVIVLGRLDAREPVFLRSGFCSPKITAESPKAQRYLNQSLRFIADLITGGDSGG